jgi:hypothetical protein
MNAHRAGLSVTLLSVLVVACRTVPVVPHAFDCAVSPELLASTCATPGPVANDATYAQLVDIMQADRKALQECGITTAALREALRRCNQAAAEYNQKIDALNRTK